MLTSVIFIALVIVQFPAGFCTQHACVPNTQFILNEQVCFCDERGWVNFSNCRVINRRICTAGQIIWQGCSKCVCQNDGKLLCNNAVCNEDTTNRNALIASPIKHIEVPGSENTWCTPYKSYYINCSICVCSASGRTADSHCARDSSCQQQIPSTTDFLASVNKNICIPKVMYLFSCLHCMCSDGGYFVLDQCVETCQKPPQKEFRRCISRTFYRKNCNVCWCPDNGVADDKYCTRLTCDSGNKLKSLQSLKAIRRKCNVHTFLTPICFYCMCDANGSIDENACLELNCFKNDYPKYNVLKTTCSPGEMVPICQECFCITGGFTNQSYCSNVCSYQGKLNILEKILKDNQGKSDLIEIEKIQKIWESDNCTPNAVYLDQGRYCLCPENGSTNFKLCTSIIEDAHLKHLNRANYNLDLSQIRNISCDPNSFVEIDCNTCFCGKNGKIDPKWCTNDDCGAKRMIKYGQTTLRNSNIHNATCIPGSIAKLDCNFCICSKTGMMKDSACTKNICSDFEDVYDEKFTCEPLAYYLVDCNVCLCPRNGLKNVEKCTKNICEKAILRSDTCTPGQFFSNECNVCVCPPNGDKSDGVCTTHRCSDSEAPWKKIFKLSQSILDSKPVQENTKPQQDLDFCFSGEEFEIGCKICVCPDVGMKSRATCSDIMCEEANTQDGNRLDDTEKEAISKEISSKKAFIRNKRAARHTPNEQPTHEKSSDCYTFNLTDSSERKECTPGSMYIIRCRQCICPYMGNINYFCRALPKGKYCEQAFPNFNYLPMGRRNINETNISNASEMIPPKLAPHHNHTRYQCSKPGKLLDECFICECENNAVIEEHCFHSDAEKCKDAKPTFLNKVNKTVVVL